MKLAANKTPAALIVAVSAAGLIAGCTSSGSPASGQATSGTRSAVSAATGVAASGTGGAASPTGSAGSGATTAGTAPSGTPATANAKGIAPCQASGLRLTQGATGGAAGSTYIQIEFTNTAGVTCTLSGYPGVALTKSKTPGSQVGTAATRAATTPATLVTLAPGTTAIAQVQLVDVLNYPTAKCVPASASYLQVYPPGQTMPLYLAFTAQACTKPVFTLGVGAVYAQAGG
ncbi:MAG TPA: DUF4232 domain-containing protein [Trebonia sp.]|jgi:hypothetical protein|nr:DUF4232 domain-containing protein [Trebonia sp.]